jgi:hypothetical protein
VPVPIGEFCEQQADIDGESACGRVEAAVVGAR